MTALVLLVLLVLIAALAPRFGADTRDGRDWQPVATGCPRTSYLR